MQSILQYRRLRRHLQAEVDCVSSSSTSQPCEKLARSETNGARSSRKPYNVTAPITELQTTSAVDKDLNPRAWPRRRKILFTAIALTSGQVGGWASSNVSAVIPQAKETFHVSDVTESLATGLYLVGFGSGSLFSGPFSEAAGRNPVYLATMTGFILTLLGSSLAHNIATQLVCRYLAGVFGCTSLTTFSGSTADMWEPSERGLIFSIATTINFSGVFLAPVVGSFIGQSQVVSWRWTEWIAIILAGVCFLLLCLFLPETNAAILRSWKARHLRQLTGDPRYGSERETQVSLGVRLIQSAHLPFTIIFHELTVALFTAYFSVVYVATFTFLTGFTFIYTDVYDFSQGSTGLCFLALVVGVILAGILSIPIQWKYRRDVAKAQNSGKQSLPPEKRLLLAIIVAPALPIGLFWMAWTARPAISYWSSLGGAVLVGMAFLGLFVAPTLYLIDMFEAKAASALAIATVVRYVAAGAMVPASIPIYRALGIDWTLTMLGCISLVLTPLPFLFYRFGHRIRKRSRNATKAHT